MNPLTQFKKIPILKLLIALAVVCFGLLMSNSLAQEVPKKHPPGAKRPPGGIPELLPKPPHGGPHGLLETLKDFDVWAPSLDPNGLPLNPKWGQQVRVHTPPSPKDSCPLNDKDTSRWTSSPQFPNCTSYPVTFNDGFFCGHHVNFMAVTYEGTVEWNGLGGTDLYRPWDEDYCFDLSRDDHALYCAGEEQVHIEFDARETVNLWDETGTWWDKFHHKGVDEGDDQAHGKIDGLSVIVIGLLGLDTYHRAKPELHPVYAMFVLFDRNWRSRQSSWAFFVRNWGNEGSCGQNRMDLGRFDEPTTFIKVQIPRAAQVVSQNIWGRARNTDDVSSMRIEAQPNPDGIELRFTLLPADKESWIMGDVTFQEPLPVMREETEDKIPPQFQALRAQIDKLPETSRKELRAQLESVIPRKEASRLEVKMIAGPTQLRETHLKSPGTVVRKSDLVRPAKDSVGELTRRKQLEVLRKFFAERGVQVDLPPEN